ncbi:MAG: hypothetical protein M3Y40_05595, partial [Chloroflexota bacterium]|nr:hypothetical protein [Chloroflexota bacterium]
MEAVAGGASGETPSGRVPPEPASRAHRLAAVLVVILVVLVVTAGGFLLTAGLWGDPGGRVLAPNVPDAIHYSWWLGRTPS